MRNILIGISVGVFLVLIGGYLFLAEGGMPVKTKDKPLPLERYFAKKAIHKAMAGEENNKPLLKI
jgi:hypothetical protein